MEKAPFEKEHGFNNMPRTYPIARLVNPHPLAAAEALQLCESTTVTLIRALAQESDSERCWV